MLEWLFKYPAASWREATLGFQLPLPVYLLGVAFLLALLLIGFSLRRQPLSDGRKAILFALQSVVALVLLGMLWKPVLRLEVAEQGENTVAWVVDSSISMQTVDVPLTRTSTADQQSRLSAAVSLVRDTALEPSAEFDAALYAQGQTLEPLADVEQLEITEPSATTDLAGGLDELLGTVADNALAAVVLVSDGSDNVGSIDAQWWQRLSAAGVPVHTVGMGRLRDPHDIQLSDVSLPEQAAPDTTAVARLRINHATAGSARVRVLSGRDLIAAEDIDLPADMSESVHEIAVPTGERGVRQLRFEVLSNVTTADPDLVNNAQPRILRVDDAPRRVLYVEGEPRWEYKFLRRALDAHPGVEIVSLLRTSPNKFYRQGVRDSNELADGFPATREALFAYDAIIIGSLEAAELNTTQQLALRDFVSVRGGSLLMLAGRHGLADGGWGRSVVAAALPVILDARLAADTFERTRAQAIPTLAGFRTPWLALGETPADNLAAWQELPDIADIQSLGAVKPGAIVLLEHTALAPGDKGGQPLLVVQRYGKGQSVVLGTSGTWRWQMGLDSTDQRHEKFWRQLSTMLVDGVIERISVATAAPVYRDRDSASVTLNAYNAEFEPLQEAGLSVQVTLPDGTEQTVDLQPDSIQPGRYLGSVDTLLDGPYTINAMTPLGGESPQSMLAATEHWWVRESGTAESFDNTLQQDFLQRVADATGGSYLAYADSQSIVDVLSQENAALKREMSLPLWNMPFLFLCLFLAKAIEWLLRLRWKRL